MTLGRPKKLLGQGSGVFSGFHENSRRTDGQHGVCVQNWRQLVSHTIGIYCIIQKKAQHGEVP